MLNSSNKKQHPKGNAKTKRKIPEYKVSKSLKWLSQFRFSIFFLPFILSNVEVPKFIHISIFVWRNHAEPITHIVFLQVLFCQVLQIPEPRKKNRCSEVEKPKIKQHCWQQLKQFFSNRYNDAWDYIDESLITLKSTQSNCPTVYKNNTLIKTAHDSTNEQKTTRIPQRTKTMSTKDAYKLPQKLSSLHI